MLQGGVRLLLFTFLDYTRNTRLTLDEYCCAGCPNAMSTGPNGISNETVGGCTFPSHALTRSSPSEPHERDALALRIVRGPLKPLENESILSQYNRLAGAAIPSEDFLRWVQNAPEGPAWHALLETPAGEIVGHTSLIPLRATRSGRASVAAKSEYSFIREEFRTSKIRGFEQTGRLKNLIYIDELFKNCRAAGWSPLLISTPSRFHRVFRSIACFPVNFPLWECLLILRPHLAASQTPNLLRWQRATLWGVGQLQRALWATAFAAARGTERYPIFRAGERAFSPNSTSLSFFNDRDSLSWRYPDTGYDRLSNEESGNEDLIYKRGSADRYLRVCQWSLHSRQPARSLVSKLMQAARQQGALGVRWAVYGQGDNAVATVRRLRSFGFLCFRRVRTLLINAADPQFLAPDAWDLNDAMFSFDL